MPLTTALKLTAIFILGLVVSIAVLSLTSEHHRDECVGCCP